MGFHMYPPYDEEFHQDEEPPSDDEVSTVEGEKPSYGDKDNLKNWIYGNLRTEVSEHERFSFGKIDIVYVEEGPIWAARAIAYPISEAHNKDTEDVVAEGESNAGVWFARLDRQKQIQQKYGI
ncbi:hypothetical protein E8E11_008002 [Didymella keratinophila]|nr:hypothetical protein E8E11_008002 [Didymella keratinophila]